MALRVNPPLLAMAVLVLLGSALGTDQNQPAVGAPVVLQESDPGLERVLQFAEERYNRGSNAMYLRKVSRLISATKQIVKGVRYSFTVELSETQCRKSAMLQTCDFHPEAHKLKTEVCLFEVWDIPWEGTTTLLKQKCEPKEDPELRNQQYF